MFELEERHWWFQARLLMTEGWLREHVLPALGGRRPALLDVGCGTGLFLQRRLEDCTGFGIDFSAEALGFCGRRNVQRVARADATRLPFADASFDVVTAFDLIEHVADDHGVVAECWRVLRPGGTLLATVPAHPLLWSRHDVSLHHHRRYTRAKFEALFDPAGWHDERTSGAFTLILPATALVRLARRLRPRGAAISDTQPTPQPLNRLMIGLLRAEAAWLRRHNLPTGVSLMTLRRKRA